MAYKITPQPHIVRLPRHTILLRFLQLLLAAIILGLASYGVAVLSASGIILTLVTGRPLPPSFAEDFLTHSHSNVSSLQNSSLPLTTTLIPTSTGISRSYTRTSPPWSVRPLLTNGGTFYWGQIGKTHTAENKLSQFRPKSSSIKPRGHPAPDPTPPPVEGFWQNPILNQPKSLYLASRTTVVTPTTTARVDYQIPYNELDLRWPCGDPKAPPVVAPPRTPTSTYSFRTELNAPIPSFGNDYGRDNYKGDNYEWNIYPLSVTPGGAVSILKRLFSIVNADLDQRGVGGEVAKRDIFWNREERNIWGSPLTSRTPLPSPGWLILGHAQTAALSIIHLVATLLTTHCPRLERYYDYPLLLLLEGLLLILWLISFCVLAAQVVLSQAIGYGTACGEDGYCYTYASWDKRHHFLTLMSLTAVLAGLMFLLYLVSFSIFIFSVIKHRRDGGKAKRLDEKSASSHPGPFSFEEGEGEGTDEEAARMGKAREKALKEQERKEKKARREDEKAIKHMRKGMKVRAGLSAWERGAGVKASKKTTPTIPTAAGGVLGGGGVLEGGPGREERGVLVGNGVIGERNGGGKDVVEGAKKKTDMSHHLSLRGLERRQMMLSGGPGGVRWG